MTAEESNIKKFILKKLFQHGYWGGRHTSVANLPKGLPSHLKGDAQKAAKELLKEGLLIAKPTHDGVHVSLNPRKKKEIDEFLT